MNKSADRVALSEDRLIRRLVKLVSELDLDRRDFVIFGSGPMLAHGLRRHVHDLDVVVRETAWQRVSQRGFPGEGSINGAPLALFWGGLIQFSQGWVSDEWNADDLTGRAEIIQGLPFAPLTDVLAYKQLLQRPKDTQDIRALLCSSRQPMPAHGLAREFQYDIALGKRRPGRDSGHIAPTAVTCLTN